MQMKEINQPNQKTKRKTLLRSLVVTTVLALSCLLLVSCSGSSESEDKSAEPVTRDFFAMDTYMTVSVYGDGAEEVAEKAEEEVSRLDAMLSTGSEDSEISKLNQAGSDSVSKETANLIRRGLDFYKSTDGAFDIAIYPIMKAWGFTDENYRVPGKSEIQKLLPLTDAANIRLDESANEVSFAKADMAIDLGGIAKGYTSSRMIEIFKECGITSGLVNLGGNVQVLGTKPDGEKWHVAIQDPAAKTGNEEQTEASYLGVLEAEDVAIITSGAYERNFTKNGKLYHHIIDPQTGRPAESGLQSVTVVSKDGTLADALSTSLYIMGKDKAIEYWHAHKDEFNCILLDDKNEIYVTSPISDALVSDLYPIHVID